MMNPLKMLGVSVFQLVSILFVFLYLLGLLNTYFSDRNDYCVMTYMFEYPQFVRIALPANKEKYPQYGLYVYAEGRMTERARKMRFDGIPVLYLPGNSGSHMQGRSLASVALRKAQSDVYDYHFDYFTVSYNEDLSGLYGGILQGETEFAAACITKILSLYKDNVYTNTVPTSVILIGHSMGGVIAKRLLAYPDTINVTNIAITLASPLEAPVINTDIAMNNYYGFIDQEWEENVDANVKNKKMLLSFGNGARDSLMPAGLTSSYDSDINALTTAIPGVWVSPDHVSIVWCKQLVMAINRFMFSIVNPQTRQVVKDKSVLMAKAKHFFQANRSMTLSPDIPRANVFMVPDAFWYEDNRRIYQISRPEISKMTYLMIRLVSFPQNRFVAIEAVNVDDRDWVFGCNAQYTQGTHRYCKQATSLTELSRWSGAATDFGKRKLATVHLHDIIEREPSWTHVLVRVSPTKKPIVLNVDINDLASRQIIVDVPYDFSYRKSTIKQETEPNSLYYELILPGFTKLYQAYFLYVEPTKGCQAKEYHVTAEMHVPWAEGHEYFHYFTHLKRSPMKLRLFKSNLNATVGKDLTDHVKVTLLLDPQCTYTISISASWYHQLAQFARNYTPVLVPYMAAILLLVVRRNLLNLRGGRPCSSIHGALASETVQPYYVLVFSTAADVFVAGAPFLSLTIDSLSSKNLEITYFSRSLLVLPVYMIALGILNILAATVLLVMVFSSQLAHRLLFRIIWRGGPALAERVAEGIQRVPIVVSILLVLSPSVSCGAASLAAGAVFYAFLISKMYEAYLEDYVYKLMAKVAARIGRVFKSKKPTNESQSAALINEEEPNKLTDSEEVKAIEEPSSSGDSNKSKIVAKGKEVKLESTTDKTADEKKKANDTTDDKTKALVAVSKAEDKKAEMSPPEGRQLVEVYEKSPKEKVKGRCSSGEDDVSTAGLHFHMMMFFLWMAVTLVNLPVLITWARNFKYQMVLVPDTSYSVGLVMAACSAVIWQIEAPRYTLSCYNALSAVVFTMATFLVSFGPQSLAIVNYGVTFIFVLITLQQIMDKDIEVKDNDKKDDKDNADLNTIDEQDSKKDPNEEEQKSKEGKEEDNAPNKQNQSTDNGEQSQNDDVTNNEDSRIYCMFKNLRDKISSMETS